MNFVELREALDNMDDCTRMECGIDAIGAYTTLSRGILEMQVKQKELLSMIDMIVEEYQCKHGEDALCAAIENLKLVVSK
jgi:hypothetical protein